MPDYDIGRLASPELTEVRTVLSRAETALDALRDHPWRRSILHIEPCCAPSVWSSDHPACTTIPHPDIAEMRDALQTTINLLRKWERTGPKKRSK